MFVTGEELRALAPAFVARSTGRAFLGYLTNQRRGLTGERHATRTRELSTRHGYDTRYAIHALPEPDRSVLRSVRAGELPLDDVLARIDGAAAQLQEVTAGAQLPAKPDVARVDAFLVRTYLEAWG